MGKLGRNQKIELILLFLILVLASFLRLYRIKDYMVFLGDEGRDALIVKRIIVDHKFTLLGPTASIAPFHLGPFYYYLMLPFLWVFNLDPLGPAVMVALFGVATVFLVYWVGRDFFNEKVGFLAAGLYAISPLTIVHSRSSWNPNVLPFFSLLLIYTLKRAAEKKHWFYYLAVGILFGITLQFHYLALFLTPTILSFLLIFAPLKKNFRFYVFALGGFLIGWSPFLLFELRHQFVNLKNLYWFLSSGEKTGWDVHNFFTIVQKVIVDLFTFLLAGGNAFWGKVLSLLLIPLVYLCWRERKNKKIFRNCLLLGIWFLWGVILFGFFKGAIYAYYFTFMFTLPVLIFSLVIFEWQKKKGWLVNLIKGFLVIILLILNIVNSPLKKQSNRQLEQTKNIAKFILEKTEGKPFNLALIPDRNTDFAYRYFLEIWEKPAVVIEPPQVDWERKTVTEQLFVICEKRDCQPLGHPLWEIAGFGIAKIDQEWEIYGVKIYKLVHIDSPK